jgi:hypothetical protein
MPGANLLGSFAVLRRLLSGVDGDWLVVGGTCGQIGFELCKGGLGHVEVYRVRECRGGEGDCLVDVAEVVDLTAGRGDVDEEHGASAVTNRNELITSFPDFV